MITIVWLAGAAILLGLAELAADRVSRGNIQLIAGGLVVLGIALEAALAYQVGWLTR